MSKVKTIQFNNNNDLSHSKRYYHTCRVYTISNLIVFTYNLNIPPFSELIHKCVYVNCITYHLISPLD